MKRIWIWFWFDSNRLSDFSSLKDTSLHAQHGLNFVCLSHFSQRFLQLLWFIGKSVWIKKWFFVWIFAKFHENSHFKKIKTNVFDEAWRKSWASLNERVSHSLRTFFVKIECHESFRWFFFCQKSTWKTSLSNSTKFTSWEARHFFHENPLFQTLHGIQSEIV